MAQAIYGMGVIVGPTLGPPLGGYIVDLFLALYFLHQYSFRDHRNPLDSKLCKKSKIWRKLKSNQVDWLGIILLVEAAL
jgi:DHA2 family multidrug resistance protein